MSTAVTTTRPLQTPRLRRESQRPSTLRATGRANTMENGASKEGPRLYIYKQQDILTKFKGNPPSLRVYLHQNHFRLNDSQETLSYASPMKELLLHLRYKTVPHNMLEEFHSYGVPFYDGCLIVEVHDFRTQGVKAKDDTNSSNDSNDTIPFSIHNYNNFITPSPHVPYPTPKSAAKPGQADGQNKGSEGKQEKDVDKENMPAPGQPASQKQTNKAKVATIVLFPTQQSHLTDLQLLANTPMPDPATYRRNQAAARAGGNPPTPLTAVPPTPSVSGRSPKRQRMMLDDSNLHEFESAVYNLTCPKLYLEPTKNFAESLALIEATTHPNNQNPAPPRKARKRTTAELAADEAEAADMQRYMLAGDEFQASKTSAASGGDEGQHAVRAGANQQTFSRFKTLATIKMNHEEAERRKKEEEARQAQAKRQAQMEADAKRREMESQNRQSEAMLQQRQELMRQQQQAQQQALQQASQVSQASQAQHMVSAAAQVSQTPLSATQPQFSSPVVRQQTPMVTAASPSLPTHVSNPMVAAPVVAASNQAAGSPARPPSVVSHHPNTMVRTASQQQSQSLSRTGTPQIVQGTPIMNSAMPARNISSTPTPRMNQASPNMLVPGSTPIMMQTPQPGPNMTPEQMQQLAQNNQMQQLRRQIQQQNMPVGMNNQQSMQQLQQMALQRANAQISQTGIPPGTNQQAYRQMLAHRFLQQALQQQQQRQQQSQQQQQQSQQNQQMTNMPPQNMPQGGMTNAPGGQLANMSIQQLRTTYAHRKQQLLSTFGSNIPPEHVAQIRQLEVAIHSRQAQMEQQQQLAQTNQMQMGQGMPTQMGVQGNANPQNAVHLQQYQQMIQQQRAQAQRQSQLLHMRQQAALQQQQQQQQQQQNGQANAGMMNGMQGGFNVSMGNMNGMNMNMGNMQGMNHGNLGMQGMQGMQGMNMGNMSQAQVQQVMMMRQAQQRAAQQQGGGESMNWSGV